MYPVGIKYCIMCGLCCPCCWCLLGPLLLIPSWHGLGQSPANAKEGINSKGPRRDQKQGHYNWCMIFYLIYIYIYEYVYLITNTHIHIVYCYPGHILEHIIPSLHYVSFCYYLEHNNKPWPISKRGQNDKKYIHDEASSVTCCTPSICQRSQAATPCRLTEFTRYWTHFKGSGQQQ